MVKLKVGSGDAFPMWRKCKDACFFLYKDSCKHGEDSDVYLFPLLVSNYIHDLFLLLFAFIFVTLNTVVL